MLILDNPKLQNVVSKTIKSIRVGSAHGEVLYITFSDDTQLTVCTYDLAPEKDIDELYICINNEEL